MAGNQMHNMTTLIKRYDFGIFPYDSEDGKAIPDANDSWLAGLRQPPLVLRIWQCHSKEPAQQTTLASRLLYNKQV
jgi:hypothetical protein